MVLSDMKKLGHQCCLFIVINMATCFASAAGRHPTPCHTFVEQGWTEHWADSGKLAFFTEISLEAEAWGWLVRPSLRPAGSCPWNTASGHPCQSLCRITLPFKGNQLFISFFFFKRDRRIFINPRANYCGKLQLRQQTSRLAKQTAKVTVFTVVVANCTVKWHRIEMKGGLRQASVTKQFKT